LTQQTAHTGIGREIGVKGVLERLDKHLARMAKVNAPYSDEEVEADLIEATKIVRSKRR